MGIYCTRAVSKQIRSHLATFTACVGPTCSSDICRLLQGGSGAENEDEEEEEEDIMAMLRRRAKDDKVMVRKSSLQVIENIMRLNPSCVTPENLQVRLWRGGGAA